MNQLVYVFLLFLALTSWPIVAEGRRPADGAFMAAAAVAWAAICEVGKLQRRLDRLESR